MNKFSGVCRSILYAAVASLGVPVLVHAESIVQTREFYVDLFSPSANFTVDPFDTQGGTRTLESVELRLNGQVAYIAPEEGHCPEAPEEFHYAGVACRKFPGLPASSPCASQIVGMTSVELPFGFSADGEVELHYDEAPVVPSGTWAAMNPVHDMTGSAITSNPIHLAFFSGGVPIPIALAAEHQLAVSISNGMSCMGLFSNGGILEVIYNYN